MIHRLPVLPPAGPMPMPGGFAAVDVLRWPLVGGLLRRRGFGLGLRLCLLAVAVVLVLHGLMGPELAPKNLATVLVWVHYRGLLVLALLVAGNLFCLGCPFILVRDLARRWFKPRRAWPRYLRSKWLAVGLLTAVLFCYELFDWWSSPRSTAYLICAYFAGALLVDTIFTRASFCKYLCPVGQFNFVASTMSPLAVQVRDRQVCNSCSTKDCIKGREDRAGVPQRRGCELDLFLPSKHGNIDCTLCLDCVHACPSDNVAINLRLPGAELAEDPRRSGIGHLSRRADLSALAVLFTFGALINAFAMVSPVYALQSWLAGLLGTRLETPVLGLVFAVGLVGEPVLLLGLAAWATRRATGSGDRLLAIVVRCSYSLVPLGFAVWVAHYAFHLLTGFLTVVPVAQKAVWALGAPLLGEPMWQLGGLPAHVVHPMQLGVLLLGLVGSLLVAWRIAERLAPGRTLPAFLPWGTLATALFAAAVWLLSQPMEMRGTFLP